jgi:hypothetical protein
MIFGDDYKIFRPSLCNFLHSPVTSSVFGPNILLRTLFSNTLSLCSSLNVKYYVSNPYKVSGRIMVLYILTFTFLDSIVEPIKMEKYNVHRQVISTISNINL